jgi:filamentous hemagglutinin
VDGIVRLISDPRGTISGWWDDLTGDDPAAVRQATAQGTGLSIGVAGGVVALGKLGAIRSGGSVANGPPQYSRLVEGGGLQVHEAAGGHLLLKHVGKSEQALLTRLASEPSIKGSSSFYSRAVAEDSVSQLLDANQASISSWLGGSGRRLRIEGPLANSVGITVTRGETRAVHVSSARVILVRDLSMSMGYRVQTGFPKKP